MASVSASMATMVFNNVFSNTVNTTYHEELKDWSKSNAYVEALVAKCGNATFDSRVFNLPKEEVVNCLIWRQQDATRNSIQSVGQANFSHKVLHGKTCGDIQDLLVLKRGINWNDYPTTLKRGSCCIKKPFKINGGTDKETIRNKWVIDNEIPIFTQDKDYINKLIFV
jgi:tRNA(His) 5'-end guanylyltransferase